MPNWEAVESESDSLERENTDHVEALNNGDSWEASEKDGNDDTNLAEVEEEGDKRYDRAGSVDGGELEVEGGCTHKQTSSCLE